MISFWLVMLALPLAIILLAVVLARRGGLMEASTQEPHRPAR
jgi:hypothetical protein